MRVESFSVQMMIYLLMYLALWHMETSGYWLLNDDSFCDESNDLGSSRYQKMQIVDICQLQHDDTSRTVILLRSHRCDGVLASPQEATRVEV